MEQCCHFADAKSGEQVKLDAAKFPVANVQPLIKVLISTMCAQPLRHKGEPCNKTKHLKKRYTQHRRLKWQNKCSKVTQLTWHLQGEPAVAGST